jgi:hypothetical protein
MTRKLGKDNTMNKPTHIRFDLRTFSCEEIESILERSSNARNLDKRVRDKYLAAMQQGQWDCGNGDTLVFDANYCLIDGQHRLAAAALYQQQTEQQVWFWCAMNCHPKASLSKDQGKLRRLGEVLQRQGIPNYNIIPGLVRSRLVLREHEYKVQFLRSGVLKAPLAMQYQYWQDHADDLQQMAQIAIRAQSCKLANASLFAQLIYEISRLNGDLAVAFADAVIDYTHRHEHDPALQLRVRLNKAYYNAHTKLSRDTTIGYVVKSWNAWATGQTIKRLQWHPTGPNAEDFPTICVVDCIPDEHQDMAV